MSEYGLHEKKKQKIKPWQWAYASFMLITAIAACAVPTQLVAWHYGYNGGLGAPLFAHIYAPWSIFSWAEIDEPFINRAVFYGELIFLIPNGVVIAVLLSLGTLRGNKVLHGSAAWAQEEAIKSMGYLDGKGVYVGGWEKGTGKKTQLLYLRHNGPEHLMVFAPTRSGKGVGLILPTLLAWEESCLVLDIKGENWALTAGWRKSRGQHVLRFDPADPSGNSASFNPLDEVRLGTFYAVQDIQNLAMMLIDPDGKGLADHWTKAAFAFFAGVLLHVCVIMRANLGRNATLSDVTLAMSSESGSTKDLLEEMLGTKHEELYKKIDATWEGGEEVHIFIASSAKEMQSKADGEASGVLSSALVNMSLYRDPIITKNISRSDFRIHDLMNAEKPVSLYLVVSPADIDRVRPLLRLMTDMFVRRICAKMEFEGGASKAGYKHRLLLLMDEFTSLGKLPIVERALAYIAGYGGKFYLIVQDITQLQSVYGKENAVMANCHTRIAYAPNTIETADTLSKMTGTTTVVEQKKSISRNGAWSRANTTVNISEVARPLLTPDECMRLPSAEKDSEGKVTKPGHMLIFTAGKAPIYGCQILYFRDPVFSERSKIPAPHVSDSLYFARQKEERKKPVQEVKIEKGFADFLREESV